MFFRVWIAILTGLDNGANHFVAKGHDAASGPKEIVFQRMQYSGCRDARFPSFRVELITFESADGVVLFVFGGLPRLNIEAKVAMRLSVLSASKRYSYPSVHSCGPLAPIPNVEPTSNR